LKSPLHLLDPRRALESAWVYRTAQFLIRGEDSYRRLAQEHLRVASGDRVLDIGCGPAEILSHLPEVDYLGFDASSRYIEWARKRHGTRGRFLCQTLGEAELEGLGAGSFDLVVAYGLVHHLDDVEALAFFALARAALSATGRLVTIDGCFVPEQSRFVRRLLERDRGHFVRSPEAYRELAHSRLGGVEAPIRHDLFRMPYTLIVLECGP
jgi:cyclopropane fatty-acyl-phospholipid synthase-like methyltransferase